MNNTFGLTDKDLQTIQSILKQHTEIEKAAIFGSRAKGNYKNGSDVDVSVWGDDLTFDTINRVSYWLNEETAMPYKFDIINYNSISEPALKEHIDRVGITFYP